MRYEDDDTKDLGRGRTQTKNEAREFDAYAERLFELPEARRVMFPGSDALARALRIKRTNLVKSGLRRHLRHISGLLRAEGFTTDDLEKFLSEGRLEISDDTGPDLGALRDGLAAPETFEGALAAALRLLPILDTEAIRRFARLVHESDDRRAYSALFKTLRQAADDLGDDD